MTPDEQSRIDAIEKDRRRRERELLLLLLLLCDESYTHARSAVRIGSDPLPAIQNVIIGHSGIEQPGAAPVIAEAMREAHAAGYRRAFLLAGQRVWPARSTPADAPHPSYDMAAQNLAGRLDSAIRTKVIEKQAEGGAVERLADRNRRIYEAFDKGGFRKGNPYALATLSTEAILDAYNGGLWDGYHAPVIWLRLKGLRHRSVIDKATTAICRERDGISLKPDNGYWLTNWPKLHFNCRSIVLPIFTDFEESSYRPLTEPMPGFGQAPAFVFGHVFAA